MPVTTGDEYCRAPPPATKMSLHALSGRPKYLFFIDLRGRTHVCAKEGTSVPGNKCDSKESKFPTYPAWLSTDRGNTASNSRRLTKHHNEDPHLSAPIVTGPTATTTTKSQPPINHQITINLSMLQNKMAKRAEPPVELNKKQYKRHAALSENSNRFAYKFQRDSGASG